MREWDCNGKAVIDSESILDNRSKKVLRCLECDFTEDLDRLKQGK
jgi:hypothetical protein